MWLARLSTNARTQFLGWCAARTTYIPVWAAHEFQRHLLAGTVRKELTKIVTETASKQREFVQIAAEQVDDTICMKKGFSQRSVYISEIQRLLAGFDRIKEVLEFDETRLRIAADEVVAFVNEHMLESDLDPIIAHLSATGTFRLSHRIPPGYQDAHKEENRLGDAVIWREILRDVDSATRRPWPFHRSSVRRKEPGRPDGILISRDVKTDWVSTSDVRLGNGDVAKANREMERDVTLPHPLLQHEFSGNGGGDFYIVHPGALSGVVEAMQKKGTPNPLAIAAWRAASLRPDVLEKMLVCAAQEEKRAEAAKTQASGNAGAVHRTSGVSGGPQTQLTTITTSDVMKIKTSAEVGQYVSMAADDREILIDRWVDSVKSGTMSPLKLGRIICVLAGDSQGVVPADIPAMVDVFQRFLPEFVNHIVLGALCTIYFDESGQNLQQPMIELVGPLLSLEETNYVSTAFDTLQRFLKDQSVSLPYIPGSRAKVKVSWKATKVTKTVPAILQEIRVGTQMVLADGLPPNHKRLLSSLLGISDARQCGGSTLKGLLSREYMVPIERIETHDVDDAKVLSWAEDVGLLPVDTNSSGGIGELNSEDG
jgi:hypothetical protein